MHTRTHGLIGSISSLLVLLGVFLAAEMVLPEVASATLSANANVNRISIDSFYHGGGVTVSGLCDPAVDIAIRVTSTGDEATTLKRKGKAAGLLWMNVGELKFDNAPYLYFVQSTAEINTLLSADEAERYTLGYAALGRYMEIAQLENEAERAKWLDAFLDYKEHQHLYQQRQGGIAFHDNPSGRLYTAVFHWPYQARPGLYQVEVFAVRDGKVVERATTQLHVEQTGAVKALAAMAKNNGAMYGVLSIIIALVCGFGVGMIFRKGGGAH